MSEKVPLAAVLGHPIAHSKSPRMHGFWLEKYGLQGHYIPIDVAPGDLEETFRMLPQLGFVGVNVTIPHKETVLKIADLVTDRATLIGAANTVIFRKDGKIHADNTDGYGFIQNLKQYAPNWRADAGPSLVIGAGGAARAVVASLLDAGAPRVLLSNRTRIKAERLQQDFGNRVEVVDWVQAANRIQESETIVNTTSLGMVGHPELRMPLDGFRAGQTVTDLVYVPLKTHFLAEAEKAGCTTVDGLGMLLHQGVPAFERFFGQRPEVDETLREIMLA